MASVSVSLDIAAPVESVWKLLGDFNGLPNWLEFIRSSRLTGAGRVRHLEALDGAVIVEALLEHSDAGTFYRYSIIEGPDPVNNYVATVSARHNGANTTTVTWASSFEPIDVAQTSALSGNYEVLYRAGLNRLKSLVEKH